MPTYSFRCKKCGVFEVYVSIHKYDGTSKCPTCNKKTSDRALDIDVTPEIFGGVVKSDSEITIGDLANRNRDRFSDDKKAELTKKHNEYKNTPSERELPSGMSRMKKPEDISFT